MNINQVTSPAKKPALTGVICSLTIKSPKIANMERLMIILKPAFRKTEGECPPNSVHVNFDLSLLG